MNTNVMAITNQKGGVGNVKQKNVENKGTEGVTTAKPAANGNHGKPFQINKGSIAYIYRYSGRAPTKGCATSFHVGLRTTKRLKYRGIGSDDLLVDTFYTDDRMCIEKGFDQYPNIIRNVVNGYPHDWTVMRILLHDFLQLIF